MEEGMSLVTASDECLETINIIWSMKGPSPEKAELRKTLAVKMKSLPWEELGVVAKYIRDHTPRRSLK